MIFCLFHSIHRQFLTFSVWAEQGNHLTQIHRASGSFGFDPDNTHLLLRYLLHHHCWIEKYFHRINSPILFRLTFSVFLPPLNHKSPYLHWSRGVFGHPGKQKFIQRRWPRGFFDNPKGKKTVHLGKQLLHNNNAAGMLYSQSIRKVPEKIQKTKL